MQQHQVEALARALDRDGNGEVRKNGESCIKYDDFLLEMLHSVLETKHFVSKMMDCVD